MLTMLSMREALRVSHAATQDYLAVFLTAQTSSLLS